MRQDRSFFEEISEKLKGLSEDLGAGDLIDAESQQREIPNSLITKVYGDKYMALGEIMNELEESATLGELSLRGRVFFEELKSEFNKMHDKLFEIGVTREELDDIDLDIYELSLSAKSTASDLTNSLSKADKLAPFASDSKKMYDALVKRIKMRAYRQLVSQNEPAGFVTPVVGRNRYTNAGVFTMHPREIDLKYLADDSNPLNHQSYVLTFDSPVDAEVENSVRGVDSPYRYQNTHYSSKTPFGGRMPRTDVLGHYRTPRS